MPGVKGMNRGNKNRYKGGRLKPDLSLSGKPKEYFRQQARITLGREPTEDEIKATCREATYRWWKLLAKDIVINE